MNAPRETSAIFALQEALSTLPQEELETTHYFADGMYARVLFRKAGTLIVGKVHKREHFYIVARGKVAVSDGFNKAVEYESGTVLVSAPGTKRAVLALEDSVCLTVHRTKHRDLDKIERQLVKSDKTALFDARNNLKVKEIQ